MHHDINCAYAEALAIPVEKAKEKYKWIRRKGDHSMTREGGDEEDF
jgi:hypothetical protein